MMHQSRPLGVRMPMGSDTATEAFDVVALAASAGGLRALSQVLGGLPAGFPPPPGVVQHPDPNHASPLSEILPHPTPPDLKQAGEGGPPPPRGVRIPPPRPPP